jgi:branched-chain amino acid transport system ATP-binding protein
VSLLRVNSINVNRGSIPVLYDVSFNVEEGEIFVILGANGAGKTTLLETISGLNSLKSGEIVFHGDRIDRFPPHKIVSVGVALVPEGRQLFPDLTVAENLKMGAYNARERSGVDSTLRSVVETFPWFESRTHQKAGTLSGGEQQMLAIGRALMSRPRLLMLDEPSGGLAPILVNQIFDAITKLSRENMTVLLVEQYVSRALELAHRAAVLESGRMVLEGDPATLEKNSHVKEAYLGL